MEPDCTVPYTAVASLAHSAGSGTGQGKGRRFIAPRSLERRHIDLAANARGAPPVLIYVFRDQDRSTTFAYSTDITGRNLLRQAPRTKWAFVTIASDHDIAEGEEAMRHLQHRGFYIFER